MKAYIKELEKEKKFFIAEISKLKEGNHELFGVANASSFLS